MNFPCCFKEILSRPILIGDQKLDILGWILLRLTGTGQCGAGGGWWLPCAFLRHKIQIITWPRTHLTLSLSKTNPVCPLKWERGAASSRLGEHTPERVCSDSGICASRHPSASLPPARAILTNQQRMKMLLKRPYFPPWLFAGGAACGCTQPKQWEFHTVTGSARLCPLLCRSISSPKDAAAQLHRSQRSPLVLPLTKQCPGTSTEPRSHLTSLSKSPLRARRSQGGSSPLPRRLPGKRGWRTRLGDERWHRSPATR